MAYYLIDYENINKTLEGFSNLSAGDTVIFFYTRNMNSLSFDLHREILASDATVEYASVSTGKNALDFQLSSYLGYLIAREPSASFVIISRDQGFRTLVDFWRETADANVTLATRIMGTALPEAPKTPSLPASPEKPLLPSPAPAPAPTPAPAPAPTPAPTPVPETPIDTVKRLLASELSLEKHEIDETLRIIDAYKTKTTINNYLSKYFKDSEKVGKITKIIKPLLKNKK